MDLKHDIIPLDEWMDDLIHPLIIAGPCSAESEKQVMSTAKQLSAIRNVRVFRAGIWKPRTRPNSFEGVGEKGLVWLKQVKQETGLKTAVEVANPDHVKMAVDHEVDILWIGARTVVNPFSLQDLANTLTGLDIPVMVKNPVNPDLSLWLGAIERINLSGIRKIAAIHRGFYFFERSPFRNAPMWELPIELKRQLPEMPLICDPSHISGERKFLHDISQKAFDLAYDGLMIESHSDPGNALTDSSQQITPKDLNIMLDLLIVRSEHGNMQFESRLEELRSEIDKIDAELINLLAGRMKIVDEIGEYKRNQNITIFQLKRWSNIVRDRLSTGIDTGLEQQFLQKLFEIVHNESIKRQTEILNRKLPDPED
ncbi:MAG: bifunctional 3-deoxy-7-phosphoheptulonate synthase/chorismate mutase type II [Bacteroidales bacterium]|nr:bifunctional 3-deoxy-7-phosphoheptulonate synthase/chorismate mutase type II [Bacteroidales bacterium]